MPYVDGFVVPVPTENKEAFIDHAKKVDHLFIKHGALQVLECWGDDVPTGKTTDFYSAVKAKPGETIMFSWVLWPDKAARDAGNEKVHTDMQTMDYVSAEMPFDGKRLIYGGFESIVEYSKD